MNAKTETINPLHVMDDGELVSKLCLTYKEMLDSEIPDEYFKLVRAEVMYRMKPWQRPQRLYPAKSAPKGDGTK